MRISVYCAIAAHLVMMSSVTCFQLPDLNSVFNSFYERTGNHHETAHQVSKARVKRQDPGIGDESQLPHEIRSAQLPTLPNSEEINPRYMPTLGNGHISTTVYDAGIYLNGLYTGTGGESHRAMIPARVMSRIQIANEDVASRATHKYILNAEEGYFMEIIDCDFAVIEHKLYIHKHFIRVLVSDITWTRKSGGLGGGKILLNYPDFSATDDIQFGESRPHHAHYQNTGQTREAEDGSSSTQSVHVFWMDPIDQLPIHDAEGHYTIIMAVDRQESSARAEFDECVLMMDSSEDGHERLFEYHTNAWKTVWARGRIELSGDDTQLQKITRFAQFYLHASLPSIYAYQPPQHSEFLYGLGRGSLAKGAKNKDYQGHVMWDNEIYILPALVLFHPDLVKRALRYRTEMSNSARLIAEEMGAQGFKYPFRSAFTGQEVSPSGCPECEHRKYYVSAAVAWAIRQFYSATRDRDYLVNTDYNGCDITREIARFFADRSYYNPETGRYDIQSITGPDETYPDRDNNAFTLAAASLAIHWARYMACHCQRNERDEVPDEWIQMALYYDLPFDNVRRLHGQFKGFLDIPNARIGQADAVMLGYPLNWNMSRDIMRHDLEYYEQVTNDLGPAMSWSFFTIGWKWVEEEQKRDTFFLKSYSDYLIQPFKIWTEFTETSSADQDAGTVNFLPGMGGFLQSLIYGYAGIRIRPDRLEFHNPITPPGVTQIRMIGMHYLGTNMTVQIDEFQVYIYVQSVGDFPLVLRKNDSSYLEETLNSGGSVTIDNPRQGFFIYTNQQSGCEHPRDHIYMPWGYSPFIDEGTNISGKITNIITSSCIALLIARLMSS